MRSVLPVFVLAFIFTHLKIGYLRGEVYLSAKTDLIINNYFLIFHLILLLILFQKIILLLEHSLCSVRFLNFLLLFSEQINILASLTCLMRCPIILALFDWCRRISSWTQYHGFIYNTSRITSLLWELSINII